MIRLTLLALVSILCTQWSLASSLLADETYENFSHQSFSENAPQNTVDFKDLLAPEELEHLFETTSNKVEGAKTYEECKDMMHKGGFDMMTIAEICSLMFPQELGGKRATFH